MQKCSKSELGKDTGCQPKNQCVVLIVSVFPCKNPEPPSLTGRLGTWNLTLIAKTDVFGKSSKKLAILWFSWDSWEYYIFEKSGKCNHHPNLQHQGNILCRILSDERLVVLGSVCQMLFPRWFKFIFLSPSWSSLNLWKGHLTIPKRSQRIARSGLLLRDRNCCHRLLKQVPAQPVSE